MPVYVASPQFSPKCVAASQCNCACPAYIHDNKIQKQITHMHVCIKIQKQITHMHIYVGTHSDRRRSSALVLYPTHATAHHEVLCPPHTLVDVDTIVLPAPAQL